MKKLLSFSLAFLFALVATAQTVDTLGNQIADEEPIFTVVEQEPEFPGGTEGLYQFIASNIKWPGDPDQDCWGKVFVSFVIEKDGSVSNTKVVRDICPGFGEEALRVVKLMPKWKPGRQRGNPVRVQFILPVDFKLK